MRQVQILGIGLLACVLGGGVLAQEAQSVAAAPATDVAADAIRQTTAADKYAFVIFHQKGEDVAGLRQTVKKIVEDSKGRAGSVEVDVADPTSQATVRKYGVNRAALPLVFVLAPNGAVTGGFPGSCDAQMLSAAMVSKPFAACLKALQDGKLVFVAVPGTNAADNRAAMKGVDEMAADEQFAGYTEILPVRAGDQTGGDLLARLKVADAGKTAVTVLLVPPQRIVGTYTGATDKATMAADVTRAMAGATCGGGVACGPAGGGCGSGGGGCGP